MTKIKIKYIDCGHKKVTTLKKIGRGDNVECEKCKTKPKKGTLNPSPA